MSNNTDVEDVVEVEEVDFTSLDLDLLGAEGAGAGSTPIVDVNPKNHTVVVQLKSGKTNTMSKSDSESLILARRAIVDTYHQTQAVSSPAQLSVVEGRKKKRKDSNCDTDDEDDPAAGTGEKKREGTTPRLINSFQKELKGAFEELAQLSRAEDPAIGDTLVSLTTFLKWTDVTVRSVICVQ